MALITTPDRNKLFTQIKHEMGWPLRPFELTDDMMISYLEMVVEDYSSLVNSWLIQQNWINLEGMDLSGDFLTAFTTKSNHYMESFTYAYSKQVGLGTNAPAAKGWELKRDFIITSGHTQHYIIPKNREVNEVLWSTPGSADLGLVDPFALNSMGAGITGTNMFSRPGNLVQPIYSTLLMSQDNMMKKRMLQSTLTYRITGLETGEKMLHLYPVPGDRYEIAGKWGKHWNGYLIWYFYYDTNSDNRDKCLEDNPDVVRLPSDAPTKILEWGKLNDVARQQIRNFLIAKVKIVLGNVRGFFEGKVFSPSEAALSMDYRHLLDEGLKLKEDTEKIILEQLDKLAQVNLTGERLQIASNINETMKFQPPKFPIISI